MEFWTQLGIEKTKDIEAVTAAYHEKLKLCNPEDKPEEFKALRAEYDEALRYARQQDKEQSNRELTPIDEWLKRLDEIYSHAPKRFDENEWNALLSDPLCEGLDSRIDVRNAMLEYLAENWHLPQKIWVMLDQKFDFQNSKDELYELFDKNFIDYAVIDGISTPQLIPFELFLPQNEGNVDAYYNLYHSARNSIAEEDYEKANATIADIERAGIIHPYTDCLKLRMKYIIDGEVADEELLEKGKNLHEKYPNDPEINELFADSLFSVKEYAKAKELYSRILEKKDANGIKYQKAKCCMALGEYLEAKRIYIDLCSDLPDNETLEAEFQATNAKILEEFGNKYNENPDDIPTRIEYAWSVLQSDDYKKAEEIMDFPVPEDISLRCDYHNIRTKIYRGLDENEKSLAEAQLWRAAVELAPEGETEEEKSRKNKLGEIAFIEALAFIGMERYDDGFKKADESIAADPTELRSYNIKIGIYRMKGDYINILKTNEEIIKIKQGGEEYYNLGCAQYELGMMQEAFDSFDKSNEYRKMLSNYYFRALILCTFDEYDDAQEIVDFLKENGIDDDDRVKYIKSLILKGRDKNADEAEKLRREILANAESGEVNVPVIWEVYFDTVVYMLENNADANDVLDIIEHGLKHRNDYVPLLMNKGYVLDERLNRHEEGLEVYLSVYERRPNHTRVCGMIGNIYYFDLKDYEKAAKFYSLQLERNESSYYHARLARCLSYMKDFDKSEEHFKKAIEMDSTDMWTYKAYADMLNRCGRYQDALVIANKILELDGDKSPRAYQLLAQINARMRNYEQAHRYYMDAYEKFGDAEDLSNAAEMLSHGGFFERFLKFLKQYKKALDKDYHRIIADYYLILDETKKHLRSLDALGNDNEIRLRRYAAYYHRKKNYKKTMQFVDEYFKNDPTSIMLLWIPIDCMKAMGNTELAEKYIEQGLKNLEDVNDAWYRPLYLTKKSYIMVSAGRFDEAKQCVEEAFKSPLCEHCEYPVCIDAYDALANYYEALGEYDKAVQVSLEGLSYVPDDIDCFERIRQIRKEHKNELSKENR